MAVTLNDLFQGTQKLRTNINDTNSFGVVQTAGSPNGLLGNTLGIEAKFNSLTDKTRAYYRTMIVFHGLSFTFTSDMEHQIRIEVFPGSFVWTSKPQVSKTDVSVRCTCADYYYTWWYYNKVEGGLAGSDFPRYKKVANSNRGPRNPAKTAGVCKHILVLANHLASKGWLKG